MDKTWHTSATEVVTEAIEAFLLMRNYISHFSKHPTEDFLYCVKTGYRIRLDPKCGLFTLSILTDEVEMDITFFEIRNAEENYLPMWVADVWGSRSTSVSLHRAVYIAINGLM